jgi:hypothetical protein
MGVMGAVENGMLRRLRNFVEPAHVASATWRV